MALVVKDRVKETTTTTGTGSVTLAGAATGFQTFNSAISVGNTTYYCIAGQGTSEWEVGVGTLSASTTLARTTVLSSSNSGSLVTFSAGTKDVFCTYPAAVAADTFGKNALINGDFQVWQRGTSFAAVASGAYTADRWVPAYTMAGVVTVERSTDVPTAAERGSYSPYSLKVDVTTADASIAASDVFVLYHKIEGNNAYRYGFGQAGTRYVTLSFWVKSTKTGTFCVSFANSAKNRSYVAEYTVSVTDTWEYKTVTIPVDTTGTWLYDSGIGIHVAFTLMCGTDFHGTVNTWSAANDLSTASQVNALDSTANNFFLADVQFEAGSVATQYEYVNYGDLLQRCLRYYEKTFPDGTAPANNTGATSNGSNQLQAGGASASQISQTHFWKVVKRGTPVITYYYYTASTNYGFNSSIGAFAGAIATSQASTLFLTSSFTSVAGSAAGTSNVFFFDASAEL